MVGEPWLHKRGAGVDADADAFLFDPVFCKS